MEPAAEVLDLPSCSTDLEKGEDSLLANRAPPPCSRSRDTSELVVANAVAITLSITSRDGSDPGPVLTRASKVRATER